ERADKHNTLTDADVRRILRDEFVSAGGFMKDNDFSLRNNRSL
ncbi:MerR family transcriptional regulator, partial [Ligilactobacillus salivarius]